MSAEMPWLCPTSIQPARHDSGENPGHFDSLGVFCPCPGFATKPWSYHWHSCTISATGSAHRSSNRKQVVLTNIFIRKNISSKRNESLPSHQSIPYMPPRQPSSPFLQPHKLLPFPCFEVLG